MLITLTLERLKLIAQRTEQWLKSVTQLTLTVGIRRANATKTLGPSLNAVST